MYRVGASRCSRGAGRSGAGCGFPCRHSPSRSPRAVGPWPGFVGLNSYGRRLGSPSTGQVSCAHARSMVRWRLSVLDEIHGARALGALLAGELEEAVDALERASVRYLVGFFCRLVLLSLGVSLRLSCRVVSRRLRGRA